jgi:hypothetical protein
VNIFLYGNINYLSGGNKTGKGEFMDRKKIVAVFIVFAFFVGFNVNAQNNNQRRNLILGQWELVESNIARDLIFERLDFMDNGTVLMESRNIRGIGPYAETHNWRIDNDGRLIYSMLGITQIYSIVELTRSTLIYEGSVAGFGFIRVKFSKRS